MTNVLKENTKKIKKEGTVKVARGKQKEGNNK